MSTLRTFITSVPWSRDIFFVLSLLFLTNTARGNGAAVMRPQVTGTLVLEGDSTLHRYSARTGDLRIAIETGDNAGPSGDLEMLLRNGRIKSAELVLAARSLSSSDALLDHNMRKALKANDFPSVRFVARVFKVGPPSVPGALFNVEMRANLSLAGVDRPLDLTATVFHVPGGIRMAGKKDLLMSDFDIRPPKVMLGALKVANLVTAHFDVELRTRSP